MARSLDVSSGVGKKKKKKDTLFLFFFFYFLAKHGRITSQWYWMDLIKKWRLQSWYQKSCTLWTHHSGNILYWNSFFFIILFVCLFCQREILSLSFLNFVSSTTFQVKTQTKCPFQRENIIFWGKYFFNIPQIFVLTNTFYLQWHFKMLLIRYFLLLKP